MPYRLRDAEPAPRTWQEGVRSRRRAPRREATGLVRAAALVALMMLGWGLFLGHLLVQPPPPKTDDSLDPTHIDGEDTATSPKENDSPVDDETAAQAPLARVRRADLVLQFGSVQEAYRIYKESLPDFAPADRGWLIYRLALAAEFLGEQRLAGVWYERLRDENTDARTKCLAEASRARVLLHADRCRESQLVLRNLETSAEAASDEQARGTVLHLLAQAYARELLAEFEFDAFLATPPHDLSAAQLLDYFAPDAVVKESPRLEPVFDELYRSGPDVDQIYVAYFSQNAPLVPLLRDLASLAQLELHLSSQAERRLDGMAPTLRLDAVSVSAALDAILDRLDLAWRVQEHGLHVTTTSEQTEEERSQCRIGLARRMLQRVQAAFPEHEQAASTRFHHAALEFSLRQYDEARSQWEQFLASFPSNPNSEAAWFNYARTLRQLNQLDASLEAYFRTVDAGGSHVHEAEAYLQAGQILIDEGRWDEALRPLIRAVTLSNQPKRKLLAIANLASVYLLLENPAAAQLTIQEGRPLVPSSDNPHFVGLLAALAEHRLPHDSYRATLTRRKIMESVVRVPLEQLPTVMARLLVAEGFGVLGLTHEQARVLAAPLPGHSSPTARRIVRESLVAHHIALSQFAEARDVLAPLVQSPDPQTVSYAQERLATIALAEERFAECAELCRAILGRKPSPAEQSRALQLLGESYQSLRQFEEAALCFAGLLPPTVQP